MDSVRPNTIFRANGGETMLKTFYNQLPGITPFCTDCGERMIQTGYPDDGMAYHYKCPNCDD